MATSAIATNAQVVAKDVEAPGFPRVIFIKINPLLKCFGAHFILSGCLSPIRGFFLSLIGYLLFASGWWQWSLKALHEGQSWRYWNCCHFAGEWCLPENPNRGITTSYLPIVVYELSSFSSLSHFRMMDHIPYTWLSFLSHTKCSHCWFNIMTVWTWLMLWEM